MYYVGGLLYEKEYEGNGVFEMRHFFAEMILI